MCYVKINFLFSIAVVSLLNQIIVAAIDNDTKFQDSTSENLRYVRQSDQRCQIPSNPPHTKYKLIGETPNNSGPGDYAQNYNVLEISCESEYKVNPIFQNHSICINGKWNSPLPNCLRACPSLMSVISTRVNCKWNEPDGNDIPLHNCLNPVEGTTVYLSCNPYFEESNISKNPVRVCREGRWDPSIPLCYPICGLKSPKAMLNIINGSNTIPGDYPWHVGIYNTQKDLICGGSILDYQVIVSAAHCFTDHDGNVNPTENYFVAAGKHHRKYDDDRDKYAQYSSILKIHVPSRYRGVINLQGYDIAILILAVPFKISLHVQPVCIELNEESPDLHLLLNRNGIVTGWGKTQSGTLAEELQEVIIPYVPFDECFKTVPSDFKRYITHDSICGGYVNLSTSVCAGDSGGGLIFKKLNAERHYIKGIVSVSPATDEGVCNSNQISVFTSIASHTDFARKNLAFNQIRQNIECTQDECLNNKPVNTSVEKCNDKSRLDCKKFKRNCTLPHFPPNGKFILNKNESYEPGAAVESNSLLSLKCDIGYEKIENASGENSSYCSDTGEWIPTPTNEGCSTSTPHYWWRDFDGVIPSDALIAGKARDDTPIYIGQVLYDNKLIPGKIHHNSRQIHIEFKTVHVLDETIKILCTKHPEKFVWVPTRTAEVLRIENKNLFEAGYEKGVLTYVGRTTSHGELTVGKVICWANSHCIDLTIVDSEQWYNFDTFEILTFDY